MIPGSNPGTCDRSASDHASARLGILWMLMTQLLFSIGNVASKELLLTYPITIVSWGRLVFQMLLVIPLLPNIRSLMVTRCLGLQLVRGVLLVVSTVLMVASIQLLPLADASAILYVAPLMITALSVPILGEHVGARRWTAVAAGFAGALVVIRPGTNLMQAATIVPLSVALTFALIQIFSRLIARRDAPMTTFVYTSWVAALLGSLFLPFIWVQPSLEGWLLMAAMGVSSGVGQYTMIRAFQLAPAAVVSPFNYTGLVWAALFGMVIFAEIPDAWTILGSILITASGLYVLRRESRHEAG